MQSFKNLLLKTDKFQSGHDLFQLIYVVLLPKLNCAAPPSHGGPLTGVSQRPNLTHEKRVNRPGKTSKEIYEVGEEVLVQNVKTKLWDQRGVITEVRTAHDDKIVSYELDINGHNSI